MIIDRNKIFTLLFVIFFLEVSTFYVVKQYRKECSGGKYEKQMDVSRLKHARERKKVVDEYEKKKYLATGNNVYERTYNRENQSIKELIGNLSKEAIPKEWVSEVKIEEFTNFILLINTPYEKDNFRASAAIKYVMPIIRRASPYLQNIAFFDKHHKCIFYLDEKNIQELQKRDGLNERKIEEAKDRGEDFTLFNSIAIPIRLAHNHIYVPVTVYGDQGAHEEMMMLDTGASMTVLQFFNINIFYLGNILVF